MSDNISDFWIGSVRQVMQDIANGHATPSDRLALARALVADMPGVVVAKVPPADVAPDEEYGLTEFRKGRRVGYNAAISAIITAGSATHD